ncbi:type II toxin-antitoxin system prevent-host-death family antitoxin [Jiella sp. MQZ9-1]|uniref:Antitoxin n=1 Tax=Jiella flava TaxID=2816857 RepID=A0A939JX32_9HYPH|nr:type II toxin-antitoxin system prevent-host-death family antitoxin [Jiella flava]MBO0662946.1 type II toxin-antitoxin system prevent-host-death family antitoxin [Jiella flava]MCD2471294.1 type II toxin-antitoxin system prevent-host-death family antitoxin [Jiella flava]
MTVVTIERATADLADLLARVEAGEEVLITRGDAPVAKLVPVEAAEGTLLPRRVPGALAHLRDKIPSDLFLQPMSEDELAAWEGKYSFPGDNGE